MSTSGGNQSDGEGGHSQLSQMAGQSMTELQDVLAMHHDVQSRFSDPAAVEVLQADRLLATVNKKAVSRTTVFLFLSLPLCKHVLE